MGEAGKAVSAFSRESLAKSFPKDSWKTSHFRLGDVLELKISLSGYRVARLLKNNVSKR